jgi:hypothetical protein
MRTLSVLGIGLGIFAVYLPTAMFVHSAYVAAPRPTGRDVELMPRVSFHSPDYYTVRAYLFRPPRIADPSGIVIYEDTVQLPGRDVEVIWDKIPKEDGSLIDSYFIRFRTSDGSDPRVNGRRYWIVRE